MATREQVKQLADSLGLSWEVVAKKRNWAGVLAALHAYSTKDVGQEHYPSPVRRDGTTLTDAVRFDRKLVAVDTKKVTSHREALTDLTALAKLSALETLDLLVPASASSRRWPPCTTSGSSTSATRRSPTSPQSADCRS